MKVISKPLIFLRYIMPVIALVFLASFVFIVVINGEYKKSIIPVLVPIIMSCIFFMVFKKFVWDLADEVKDNGNTLIVTKSGVDIEIPLSNIINVSSAMMQNPPRITLRLREPCSWGDEIAFCPLEPGVALIRTRSSVADDLINRIDNLR